MTVPGNFLPIHFVKKIQPVTSMKPSVEDVKSSFSETANFQNYFPVKCSVA